MEKKLSLLIFPVILGTAPQISAKHIRIVLLSFAVSCVAISMVCLADLVYTIYSKGISYSYYMANESSELNFGFHPSYFSIYAVFSIFIFIYSLLKDENRSVLAKLPAVLAIIYLIIFILFQSSRIGILSLSILFIGTVSLYFYQRRKFFYGIIIMLFFIFAIFFTLQFFPPIKEKFKSIISNSNHGEYDSNNKDLQAYLYSIRFQIWKSTVAIIKENKLVGVGTGNLQQALQEQYARKNYSRPYLWHYNPHNQFLEITATLGIIGLFVFLLVLFYPLYKSWQSKNYLFLIFILLFIFIGMVECPLEVQKGVVWFAFFNSLLAFHSLKNQTIDSNYGNN